MKKNSSIYIFLKKLIKKNIFLLSIHDFFFRKLGVIVGLPLVDKILVKDSNIHYFIKNKHLGDTVRTIQVISLFKHYKEDEGKKIKTVVLTRKNLVGLVKCCKDVDEVRVLSPKELKYIQWFAMNTNNAYQIHPNASTAEEEISLCSIPDSYWKNNLNLLEIPHSLLKESVDYAERYIKDHAINIENTIILAPYAGSSSSVNIKQLSKLANHYKNKNYCVLTNAAPNQEVVEFTDRVFLLPDQLLGLVTKGPIVVGVQSGFMDICEWMDLSHKLVKIHVLKNSMDFAYYNKKVSPGCERVQKFRNGISIYVSNTDEEEKLSDDLINLIEQINAEERGKNNV